MKTKNPLCISLVLGLFFGPLVVHQSALAAQIVINFDDAPAETIINTRYAGVTFTNPIGGNIAARSGLGFAPSSPNVVCVTNGGTPPFFDSPFGAVDAIFATHMRVVKIDVRPVSQVADHLNPTASRPYLQAFDAAGNLLSTVYYAGPLPQGCCNEVGPSETLTYASASANIARVRFSSQQPIGGVHTYGLFDNLQLDDGYYTLSVNIVGLGYVTTVPFGAHFYGDIVQLTASPFAGWTFKGWSGYFNSTLNSVLPIMFTNISLTAVFMQSPPSDPGLRIVRSGNNAELSWSTNTAGYTLQSASQLSPTATWTTVPVSPTLVNGRITATTSIGAGNQYFRLIWPGVTTIPGLFNTGDVGNGALLASGTVDPHWQLIQSADPAFPGPNAMVLNDSGYPIPPWLTNGPASKWIAPQASEAAGNLPGSYTYRITFDLTGLEPATAVITGAWTSDDAGTAVRLNGVATGFTSDGNFVSLGNLFTIRSGFVAGINTLDFVVSNGSVSANPTGVRVELSGTANFKP